MLRLCVRIARKTRACTVMPCDRVPGVWVDLGTLTPCVLHQKPDGSKKKKDKKKKKKKKKFSYAKWMKQATALKRSMSQEKRDVAERIREGTGGGEFEKLDRI